MDLRVVRWIKSDLTTGAHPAEVPVGQPAGNVYTVVVCARVAPTPFAGHTLPHWAFLFSSSLARRRGAAHHGYGGSPIRRRYLHRSQLATPGQAASITGRLQTAAGIRLQAT
ncbi:hypothetical protein VPH35_139325 [Triticum aestivum]